MEETVLKRRKKRLRDAERSEKGRAASRALRDRKKSRQARFSRVEKLIKSQQLKRRDNIRMDKRVKKKTFLSDEPFLGFVIRINE